MVDRAPLGRPHTAPGCDEPRPAGAGRRAARAGSEPRADRTRRQPPADRAAQGSPDGGSSGSSGAGGPGGTGGPGGSGWGVAVRATLHCLTGCAIGEVLGMIIGVRLGLSMGVTIALAVILAFVFGYALTMRGMLRAGVSLKQALRIALAADTLSIMVMELVDNLVLVVVPGAMAAELADGLFWGALAFALAVAFVVTVPVNRWMIARGRGHAVVHARH